MKRGCGYSQGRTSKDNLSCRNGDSCCQDYHWHESWTSAIGKQISLRVWKKSVLYYHEFRHHSIDHDVELRLMKFIKMRRVFTAKQYPGHSPCWSRDLEESLKTPEINWNSWLTWFRITSGRYDFWQWGYKSTVEQRNIKEWYKKNDKVTPILALHLHGYILFEVLSSQSISVNRGEQKANDLHEKRCFRIRVSVISWQLLIGIITLRLSHSQLLSKGFYLIFQTNW